MGELKKREEFKSDKSRVFQTIKDRLLDNSKPTGLENQYVIDNLGVTMTYTIKEIVENEKMYIIYPIFFWLYIFTWFLFYFNII